MELVPRRPMVAIAEPSAASPRRRRARGVASIAGFAGVVALVASLLAAGSAAAAGTTFFVAKTGSNANACTQAHPCRTISHAVHVAPAGSTISVAIGTYHEQVFVTKRLILRGHGAVIDAHGLLGGIPPLSGMGIIGMAVLVAGPNASGTVVSGFTIENAPAEGILAAQTSNVSFLHNELKHNDQGATTAFSPLPFECAAQGEIPGDCGEALHLLTVSNSRAIGNNVHDNVGGFLLTDEVGPTHGNLIEANVARNNKLDCGFTLPSHNASAVSDPHKGGVYGNVIIDNVSVGNGGAGVGMFAPFPARRRTTTSSWATSFNTMARPASRSTRMRRART